MYLTTYALKNKTVCQNKVYNKSVIVLSGASDSCLMCDYVRIINFRIMFNRHRAKNTLAQLFWDTVYIYWYTPPLRPWLRLVFHNSRTATDNINNL